MKEHVEQLTCLVRLNAEVPIGHPDLSTVFKRFDKVFTAISQAWSVDTVGNVASLTDASPLTVVLGVLTSVSDRSLW